MPSATRTNATVTYFSLDTQNKMLSCLGALDNNGFKGSVSMERDSEDQVVWKLTIVKAQSAHRVALIGDYLLWDGVSLDILSADEFTANYTV